MISSEVRGRSFILVIPSDFGIYEVFNYNLKKFGFDLISVVPECFRYTSKKKRAANFLHKTFFQNRNYKRKLIKEFHSENIKKQIGHLEAKSIDYVLVIRPDIVERETLDQLFKIGKKVIAYQWDGLERFPKVFEYIDLFENFLIFDEEDFINYRHKYSNLQKCENFFFDHDNNAPNNENSATIYYVGTYIRDRVDDLVMIVKELEKYPVNFDINLRYHPQTKPINENNIKFFRDNLDFKTNINRLKNAKVLLDFKVKDHNGLSLRFFEALKYEKKIITNNMSVLNYNFYDPQNIFVLYHDDLSTLGDFLSSDYKKQSAKIVDQYSFSTWLSKYVI